MCLQVARRNQCHAAYASHHMKILCDAEIVVGRKEGKWTHYSISEKGVEQAKECLRQLTTLDVESENKSCCEK